MEKIDAIIAATPLFKGLSPQQLAEIAAIVIDRGYRRGEFIFMEGDAADGFYIVAVGQVKIFKTSLDGKEQILHIYGPGNPFGEVPVVELIGRNPSLSMNMLAELSMRLRQFTVQIENLSLKEVPSRLASYLIYLSREQDSPGQVTLNISKGQLASLLGTIPETLSRIFAKMSTQNLIRVDGKRIRLLDTLGLEDLSTAGKLAE